MGGSEMAYDAMIYIGQISAILLIVGGVSFADVTISFMVRLFKKMRQGGVKW